MKKQKPMEFEVTRDGFTRLSEYDFDLMNKARTVVMWYLEASYGKTNDNQTSALHEAALWCGFKTSISKSKDKVILLDKDQKNWTFYSSLFNKFKNVLETLKIDEHDDMGILDETIQVANIMLKYKYVIALKRKKKTIFSKILELF